MARRIGTSTDSTEPSSPLGREVSYTWLRARWSSYLPGFVSLKRPLRPAAK